MTSPACALAAVRNLEHTLFAGKLQAGNIALLSSSWLQNAFVSVLADLRLDLGRTLDLYTWTPTAMAQHIAQAAHISLPAERVGHAAAEEALFRSVLWRLPLQYFRPPNAPTRHADKLYPFFSHLRSIGVQPAEYVRWVQTHRGAFVDAWAASAHAELADAYSAWCEIAARAPVMSRDSLQFEVLRGLHDSHLMQQVPQPLGAVQHVICTDAHNLGVAALRMLWRASVDPPLRPQLAHDASVASVHVHLVADSSSNAAAELRRVVDNVNSRALTKVHWQVELADEADFSSNNVLKAARDRLRQTTTHAVASASANHHDDTQFVPTLKRIDGVHYVQVSAGSTPAAGACCIGAESEDAMLRALPDLVRTYVSPGWHRAQQPLVVVACRNASHARSIAAYLNTEESALASLCTVVSDTALRLRDVEPVRLILSMLKVLAGEEADQHLYHLCTSSIYGMRPADASHMLAHRVDPITNERPSMRHCLRMAAQTLVHGVEDSANFRSIAVRVTEDLDAAEAEYLRTGSVAATVARFIRKSRLYNIAVDGADDDFAATLPDALAQLTQLLYDIETGSARAITEVAAIPEAGFMHEDIDGTDGIPARRVLPPRGLPFVVASLEAALQERDAIADHGAALADVLDPAARTRDARSMALNSSLRHDLQAALRAFGSEDVAEIQTSPKPQPSPLVFVTTWGGALRTRPSTMILFDVADSFIPGSFVPGTPPPIPRAFYVDAMTESPAADPFSLGSLGIWPPTSKQEHLDRRLRLLDAILARAVDHVCVVTRSSPLTRPLGHRKRSRFLDLIFGRAPGKSSRQTSARSLDEVSTPPAQTAPAEDEMPTRDAGDSSTPGLARPQGDAGAAEPALAAASSISYLSFTRLQEYLTCPYRYYLRRIAKVPQSPLPTLAYGAAMHAGVAAYASCIKQSVLSCPAIDILLPKAAQDVDRQPLLDLQRAVQLLQYLNEEMEGPELAVSLYQSLPDRQHLRSRMMQTFEHAWITGEPVLPDEPTQPPRWAANAPQQGEQRPPAVSSEQWRALHASAESNLPAFGERELSRMADAFMYIRTSNDMPRLLGAGQLSIPVLVEYPFSVRTPGGVELRGVLDRVDVALVDGKPQIVLREYKSSMHWHKPGSLAARGRNSKQMAVYAAALRSVLRTSGIPELVKLGDSSEAQLVVLEAIELTDVMTLAVSAEQQEAAMQLVDDVATKIGAGTFLPSPSSFACGNCMVRAACAYADGAQQPESPRGRRRVASKR